MASRVVEVLYKLKDLFTPTAKKIDRAYDELGTTAEKTGKKVDSANTQIDNTLGRLQARFRQLKLAAGIAAIGTAAVKTVGFLNDLAQGIRETVRAGARLGGTAQDFLDVRDAAAALGADSDKVTSQLNRLQRQLTAAAGGSERAQKRFEALGINFRELEKLAPDERIRRLAAALQAATDNQEGLARLSALIGGEAGTGLQLLLEQAPEKLAEVLATSKEVGTTIDEDVVKATEKWLNLQNKVNQSWRTFTGQLGEWVALAQGGVADFFGAGETLTPLQEAEEELANIQARIDDIATSGGPDRLREARLETQAKSLRRVAEQIGNLRIAQAEARRTNDEYVQTSQDNIEANDEFEASLAQTTDALKKQTKAVSENLRQQRREYQDARRDQIAVEREFKNIIADITGPEVEDVALGDVFARLNQSIAASERGDLEEAVRLALEGADYLTLLKEKGTETQGTLGFLAKQLAQVGNQAAAARTAIEKGDVTGAEAVEQSLAAQLTAIKQVGEETGRAYGQSLVAAAQEILNQNPVQPRVAEPAAAPSIQRNGNSFSDGTDFRQRQVK